MIIKRQKNLTDEQMKFSTSYEMHETRGTLSTFYYLKLTNKCDNSMSSVVLLFEHHMNMKTDFQMNDVALWLLFWNT